MKCHICDNQFDSARKLSKHFRDQHNISSQDYYDKYVKADGEEKCKFCGDPNKFINVNKGYASSCIKCRSLKTKEWRAENAQDEEKHNSFVKKVRANQTRIWADRKEAGDDASIRSQIGETIKANNSLLTKEEMAARYGWLNKLSDEEKDQWKADVMFKTGAHKWWETASEEEKQIVYLKRIATKLGKIEQIQFEWQEYQTYEEYRAAVDYITAMSYFNNKDEIDPTGLRGQEFHLDHIFSVRAGYAMQIEPEIIGSKYNLRMLAKSDNLSKHCRCDIEIETLKEQFYGS